MYFSEKTIFELAKIDIDLSYTNDLTEKEKEDVWLMFETNMQRPGKRSKEQVYLDTLRGYMCEVAINRYVENCIDNAPVTKGGQGLTYQQRKTDKIIDGLKVEVKSFERKYIDTMPLSSSQFKSVNQAIPMNDYFLIMSWSQIKKRRYRISSHYLIEAKTMSECFMQINWPYSKYGIDKSKISDYNGIDFREDLVGWYPSNVN